MKIVQVNECALTNELYERSSVSMSTSKLAAVHIMSKEFQGKRGRSFYDKNFKNNLNIDVMKEKIDTAIEKIPDADTIKEDTFDKMKILREIKLQSMYPPFRKDATKIHEVYSLYDLIPQKVLDSLEEDAIAILENRSETM